jgi:hypothetical protein
MSNSRFPYVVLATMLLAEFGVQGAETARSPKKQTIGASVEPSRSRLGIRQPIDSGSTSQKAITFLRTVHWRKFRNYAPMQSERLTRNYRLIDDV